MANSGFIFASHNTSTLEAEPVVALITEVPIFILLAEIRIDKACKKNEGCWD